MGKLVVILQSWLPLPFTFKTLTFISTNTIYLSANIDKKGHLLNGELLQTWPLMGLVFNISNI